MSEKVKPKTLTLRTRRLLLEKILLNLQGKSKGNNSNFLVAYIQLQSCKDNQYIKKFNHIFENILSEKEKTIVTFLLNQFQLWKSSFQKVFQTSEPQLQRQIQDKMDLQPFLLETQENLDFDIKALLKATSEQNKVEILDKSYKNFLLQQKYCKGVSPINQFLHKWANKKKMIASKKIENEQKIRQKKKSLKLHKALYVQVQMVDPNRLSNNKIGRQKTKNCQSKSVVLRSQMRNDQSKIDLKKQEKNKKKEEIIISSSSESLRSGYQNKGKLRNSPTIKQKKGQKGNPKSKDNKNSKKNCKIPEQDQNNQPPFKINKRNSRSRRSRFINVNDLSQKNYSPDQSFQSGKSKQRQQKQTTKKESANKKARTNLKISKNKRQNLTQGAADINAQSSDSVINLLSKTIDQQTFIKSNSQQSHQLFGKNKKKREIFFEYFNSIQQNSEDKQQTVKKLKQSAQKSEQPNKHKSVSLIQNNYHCHLKQKQQLEGRGQILISKIVLNLNKNFKDKQDLEQCLNALKKNSHLSNIFLFIKNPIVFIALEYLIYEYFLWKQAYNKTFQNANATLQKQLIEKPSQFDIESFLMSFQQEIRIDSQTFEKELRAERSLQSVKLFYIKEINKGRRQYNWTQQFVKSWRQQHTNIQKLSKFNVQQVSRLFEQNTAKLHQSQQIKIPVLYQIINPQKIIADPYKSQNPFINETVVQKKTAHAPNQYQSCAILQGIQSAIPRIQKFQTSLKNTRRTSQRIRFLNADYSMEKKQPRPLLSQQFQNLQKEEFQKIIQDEVKKQSKRTKRFTRNNQKKQGNDFVLSEQRRCEEQQKNKFPTTIIYTDPIVQKRIQSIIKYVSTKSVNVRPQNIRRVAEIINQSFQTQMKRFLIKAIEYAKIDNPKNNISNAGDQFKYFSQNNQNIKMEKEIRIQNTQFKVSQIFKIAMPNKLEIYSYMRHKQAVQEVQLREKCQEKLKKQQQARAMNRKKKRKNCGNKRKEEYFWSDMLKLKEKIPSIYQQPESYTSERLVVKNKHMLAAIQDDPYFCDGIAMFYSLHS